MQLEPSIPRFVTKSSLARLLNCDPRRKLLQQLRPDAVLIEGNHETPLFLANIPSALSVNSDSSTNS